MDTADYASSDAGVTVSLAAGTGAGGHAQGDVLTGIENLVGSAHNDDLTGNGFDNLLEGGAGDDALYGNAPLSSPAGQAGWQHRSGEPLEF